MVGLASRPWIPAPARGLAFGLAALLRGAQPARREQRLGLHAAARRRRLLRLRPRSPPLARRAGRWSRSAWLRSLGPCSTSSAAMPTTSSRTLRHAIDLALVWSVVLAAAGWLFAAIDAASARAGSRSRASRRSPSSSRGPRRRPRRGRDRPALASRSDRRGTASSTRASPPGRRRHFGGLGSNRYDFWRVGADRVQAPSRAGHRPEQLPRPVPRAAAKRRRADLPAQPRARPALADGPDRHGAVRGLPRPDGPRRRADPGRPRARAGRRPRRRRLGLAPARPGRLALGDARARACSAWRCSARRAGSPRGAPRPSRPPAARLAARRALAVGRRPSPRSSPRRARPSLVRAARRPAGDRDLAERSGDGVRAPAAALTT